MTATATFNTFARVIEEAYANAGLVAEGQTPNSEKFARGLNKLNTLALFLQTKGLKLFSLVDTSLPLVAGTYLYPLGPGATGISMTKPFRVIFGYFLNSTGQKIPMTALSWQEWTTLNQSTSSPGQPINYFVDKQAAVLNISVWPTPDTEAATGTVHLVLQTELPQGTTLSSDTAFPIEWFSVLAWGLADELATGQPQEIVQRCANKYKEYREALDGWDVEDAQTFFTPDPRGEYYASSFR